MPNRRSKVIHVKMGIPGLTSFIKRNSTQYFENLQLKDTLVIIDGYALTNFLYSEYENQTSAFLGDYDLIANVYTDFINLLLKCNITPIFVFDGAYEQRKIETIMQRMSERIHLYSQPIKTPNCMPYFGSDILFDILNDMDIPHVNCDYEADSEIVVLAKLLNCPVISRDSDFYLNTVPYIPLDMITLDLKSSENVINCRVYNVERLLEGFGGLNIDYLPLVAALLGNDYIRPDTFASLLRLNPGTFNCGIKLKRITNWLRQQQNVNSAIFNMTKNLSCRDYITHQVTNIIHDYKNINSKYLSCILQYKSMSKYQNCLKNNLKTNEKHILPQWLEDNYRKGTVNSEVMTIVTLKKIFFKVCIENIEKPPYYVVSFNILEKIFGLLFGKNNSILGIGRKNGLNIGQYKIKPYIHNPYVPLNDINKTDLEYRKNIILSLIGTKAFNGIPKDWELFILTLIYWANHTNNHKSSHLHSLIVNAITFNIIKKPEMGSQNETFKISDILNLTDKSIVEQNIFNVKKEDCLKAMEVLSKYFKIDQYNDKNLYHKIIHPFAEFQSCVYNFLILNSLLDFPYEQCSIKNFFEGSFLYNLCIKMENHDPETFVTKQLFSKSDSLNKLYTSILSHLHPLLFASKKEAPVASTSNKQKPKRIRNKKSQK